MKRKLLSIFYFAISKLGIFKLFYFINRHKKIVLTYHNIIPDHLFDDTPQLGVSHSELIFRNHIQLIKKRFRFAVNERVLITFDDGYKNQYEIAAKILEQNQLRGIYFISFKLLIEKMPLAIDQIMRWISYVPVGHYPILDTIYDITDDNRQQIGSALYIKLLKNYKLWDIIEAILNTLYRFDDLKINSELKRLRFDSIAFKDVTTLIENGHHVAAHSWDHKPLSTLPLALQRKDFLLSKKYAEQYCNSRWYSYPFGGIDEVSPATANLCAEYGFTVGYMNTLTSPNWKQVAEEYQCARMSLPNDDDVYMLDAKLSGFELFCKNILTRPFQFYFNSAKLQNA